MKKQIETILRSYFVDQDKDNHWGTLERTDQLLALFTEEMERIIDEVNSKNLEYMEPCEPDCDEVRHARHQGSWDHYWKMDQYLGELKKGVKTNES